MTPREILTTNIIDLIRVNLNLINVVTVIFILFMLWKFILLRLNLNKKIPSNIENILSEANQLINLGIMGTFLGIVIGLFHFDTQNMNLSIRTLLDAMKMAFLTSVTGMFLSYNIKVKVNNIVKNYSEYEVSNDPVVIIRSLNETLKSGINQLNNNLEKQNVIFSNSLKTFDELIQNYQNHSNNLLKNISAEHHNKIIGSNKQIMEMWEKADKQVQNELEKTFNIFASKLGSLSEKYIYDYELMTSHLEKVMVHINNKS